MLRNIGRRTNITNVMSDPWGAMGCPRLTLCLVAGNQPHVGAYFGPGAKLFWNYNNVVIIIGRRLIYKTLISFKKSTILLL